MKKLILILTMILLNFTVFSETFKRTDKIDEIRQVLISGSAKINITNSSKESLTFDGREDVIKDIKLSIKGSFLEIIIPKKTYLDLNNKITITLNLKELNDIELNGASELLVQDFSFKQLKIKVDGANDVQLKNNIFDDLFIDINGQSKLTIDGKAKILNATVNGVGKLEAFELKAKKAQIKLNGAGSIQLNAQDTLSVTVNGIGKVIYKGKPQIEKSELNGLGKIENYTE